MRTKQGINDLIKGIMLEGSVNVTNLESTANRIIEALIEENNLIIPNVVKSLPNDEEVKAYIDTLPYYGTCTTEYNEGFEDGIKWLKGQMSK